MKKFVELQYIKNILEMNNNGLSPEQIQKELFNMQCEDVINKYGEPKNTLFGYMGGKSRTAPQILPLIIDHTLYCEPFFGSGAVLFAKGFKKVLNSHLYQEVINDLDYNVINFYKVLRDNLQELIELLDDFEYSNDLHKKVYTNKEFYQNATNIEKAAYFYFNLCSGFGAQINHGFGYGVTVNQAAKFLSKLQQMYSYKDRLKQTIIFNESYDNVISRVDRERNLISDGSVFNTFFYLDPPYYNTTTYNVNKGDAFDFEKLVKTVKSIKGYFMLSHYDSEWLRDNFPDNQYFYHKIEHTITMHKMIRNDDGSMNKRPQPNQEIVVLNYDITKEKRYIDNNNLVNSKVVGDNKNNNMNLF